VAEPATPALRAFVRNGLGCTCPEAVFEAVARTDLVVGGRVAGVRLVIGDRLLIYVAAGEASTAAIDALAAAGLQDRDEHGFNRFRLVVALADGEMLATELESAFAQAVAGDAKAHLHRAGREVIAAALGHAAER
jgi:hypothetical protein